MRDVQKEKIVYETTSEESDTERNSPALKITKKIIGLSLHKSTSNRRVSNRSESSLPPNPSSTAIAPAPTSTTPIPTSATPISTSFPFPIPSIPNPIFSNSAPPTPDLNTLMGLVTPTRTPSPDLDLDLTPDPLFLGDELTTAYSNYLYFRSRIPIFQGFADNGPFPSMTTILFPTDPHNGLSRSCSDRLDVLIRNLKVDICNLHAENYEDMAKTKWREINTLINNAKTAFGEEQINEIVIQSKQRAFNKAQLLKRNRKRARTAPQQREQNSRIRNLQTTDQRRGRDHSRS